ncbi:MAG TPA: DUF4349 domain-containing protein [Candidatus Acidoferrum sp.]|nr:DUF4349 domain-containing protein [Candidatus Acidoferrum sp.]
MSTTPHLIDPEEIMAHLDGELPADRVQSVSTHLESCVACQELVTSLRNTSQSLSNWTVAAAPVNARFVERLFAAAKAPLSSRSLKFQVFPSQRWRLVTASVVSILLLVIIIGSMGGRYNMTVREARQAVTKHVAEQEAVESHLSEEVSKFQNPELRDPIAGSTLPPPKPSANSQSAGPQSGAGYKSWLSNTQQIGTNFSSPMIARTVSLSIIARDFDSARSSLETILARHNGYAADLNVATPQGAARSLQASLRIPAPQFAAAVAELKSLGRVELENQNGEEVTQQHADLVARLKNSRETEQRLQAILTERTGKISDVLSVEQEIARVRGEIEQMEAEQKNLEHRVDFATIDLKLSEEYKAKLDSPAPAISTLIHNAAVNGYRNVADTLLSIVLFFAEYGPVLCFWLFLLSVPSWLVWRRWRHATAAI